MYIVLLSYDINAFMLIALSSSHIDLVLAIVRTDSCPSIPSTAHQMHSYGSHIYCGVHNMQQLALVHHKLSHPGI